MTWLRSFHIRMVVWCAKLKMLRNREYKVCLNERAILRLLDQSNEAKSKSMTNGL